MPAPLTKDNPGRHRRDLTIAQSRLQGATYRQLAKDYNISFQRVAQILTDPEIKDVLNTGTQEIVKLVPKAIDNYDILLNGKDMGLRHKASQDLLKTVGIMPSHTVNQFFTSIQQDNSTTVINNSLMAALGADSEVIDAEVEDDD